MPKRILIVEDMDNLKKIISLKLTQAGFDVTEVSNGHMAIDILDQQKFDLIITDIVMPHKNGLEFLGELKQKNDQTKVIVLSNVSRMEERNEVKNLGVNIYLVKIETTLEILLNKVQELLG